ncbi:hypothetical protein [Haliovirga abyssi]|uniref:Uncharacterized protein n=1 Tax=Haliovirga abyssi TaxID=2996794 RepID=A0AAU9DU71_9FUSO|nr:hypothetical protein [Haliovirga abyssi]BDU50799.1 hypothetical protein HLVA_13680 [Haliovirga abyssi]
MKISDKILFYIFLICLFLIVVFNWSNKPFYSDNHIKDEVIVTLK